MTVRNLATICTLPMLGLAAACQSTEPSLPVENQSAVSALFDHLDYQFPMEQNCSESGPVSVKQFIALSLSHISETESGNGRIAVDCKEVRINSSLVQFYAMDIFPKAAETQLHALDKGEEVKQCQISFSVDQNEVVWSRAIYFLWDEQEEDAIEPTFRCITIP